MDIALISKDTNMCENVAVFDSVEIATEMFREKYILAEVVSSYGIGDIYADGEWSKPRQIQGLTNAELREQAYETILYKEDGTPLITWEGIVITIDTANKKWLNYSAEGNPKAGELSDLIVSAKKYIRELYINNNLT